MLPLHISCCVAVLALVFQSEPRQIIESRGIGSDAVFVLPRCCRYMPVRKAPNVPEVLLALEIVPRPRRGAQRDVHSFSYRLESRVRVILKDNL